MGAGRNRFQRAPSFTKQLFTYSSSTSSGAPASSALRSALAMALRNTFSICFAARLGVKCSVCSAACAFCPRIKSITSRAFCGDIRTCRASACASIEPACGCSSAITYAFGAAGAAPPPAVAPPGAAPPAGAAPAAFSSAAFTACPLHVRVGENSPSLCPIICSVTYTGINFFPLCTAMVCPIISGTIVERRDQVFTTFFSLRVFSPSTLSRKWPSTNGPFFSERAIVRPYSSPLRKRLHCARRIFLNPRTGPGTRCDFGQNGHTKRVPCALGMRSTITDQPGLHSLYSTGSGGATTTFTGRAGLAFTAARFADARFTGRLVRRLAARPVRVVLVARMVFTLTGPPSSGSLVMLPSLLPSLHDLSVRTLVPARLLAQRRESPGRLRVIALDLAFSSTVRMIHRVHGHAAHRGLNPVPPRAAGLSERFIFMVQVANLPHRG